MSSSYELPTIILRNARYRGHRESEKRLGSHNEQVYEIHKLNKKIGEQEKEIQEAITIWHSGEETQESSMKTIVLEKNFPASATQTMYHVIEHEELLKVNSVVVKLNGAVITNFKVFHGSIYIDLESLVGAVSSTAILTVEMNVDVVEKPFVNMGLAPAMAKVKRIDERLSEVERKYIEYENAHE